MKLPIPNNENRPKFRVQPIGCFLLLVCCLGIVMTGFAIYGFLEFLQTITWE